MTDKEHGPFRDEREALATRAAARIRAAFDAKPGVGAGVPEALRVMTDACAECGVELGRMDLSTLQDIAWRETFETVSLAGMIRRAFEAGKAAALEGAETRWALRYRDEDGNLHPGIEFTGPLAEANARSMAASIEPDPGTAAVAVRREVTPWREVADA